MYALLGTNTNGRALKLNLFKWANKQKEAEALDTAKAS